MFVFFDEQSSRQSFKEDIQEQIQEQIPKEQGVKFPKNSCELINMLF